MISFITPESDFPTFDVKGYASVIAKAYLQFTDARLMEALVARFGSMPPDEEIVAHCMKIIDKDKVTHFVWFNGEKPKLGEVPDMSGLLCSIAPPKFFIP